MIPPVTPVMTPVGAGLPVAWRGVVGTLVPVTCAPTIGSFVMVLITTPSMEALLVCRRRNTEAAIAVMAIGELSKEYRHRSGVFGGRTGSFCQRVRRLASSNRRDGTSLSGQG